MLDAFIMKRLRTPLRAMARPLASVGVTATQLTVSGACFGFLAAFHFILSQNIKNMFL